MFIRHEDKVNLLNKAGYTGIDCKYMNTLRVKSVSLEPDSLLYSWGSAAHGKLGISDNYYQDFESDALNQFFQEDNQGVEKSNNALGPYNNMDLEGLTLAEKQDLQEFESRHLFTTKPQPIIKLLGEEVR